MIIILIGGKARVGKTTLANCIAEYCLENRLTPKMVPFAYGIKKAAELKGLSKDKDSIGYRDFCQTLGETMRIKDPDYWVNEWKLRVEEIRKEEIEQLKQNPELWKERVVIVDDCRYMNEIAIGREYNATSIFVKQGKRKLIEEDAEWRNHESEELSNKIESKDKNYTDLFYFYITNDSTVDVFKKHCIKNITTWLGFLADGSKPECNCELCKANRENREPDPERIIEDLIDILEKALDDEDNIGDKK
jgi:hypothetical protein